MERAAGCRKHVPDRSQIESVVRVTAIGGATARMNQAAVAKFAQVI